MRSLEEQEDGPSDCRGRQWPKRDVLGRHVHEATEVVTTMWSGVENKPDVCYFVVATKNLARPQSWAE
jgi:hypothetical protein